MNLPSTPTDNLYKFWALAGLITCVFCVYQIVNQYVSFQDDHWQLNYDTEVIELKNQELMRKFSLLDRRIAADDAEGVEEVVELIHRSLAEYEELIEVARGLNLMMAEKNVGYRRLLKVGERRRDAMWLYGALASVCAFACGRGFRLWYDRLQKYQDAVVAHEAARLSQAEHTTGPSSVDELPDPVPGVAAREPSPESKVVHEEARHSEAGQAIGISTADELPGTVSGVTDREAGSDPNR